ncbi:hypothetical protein AOLI_G00061690 [Acnodon oligacanthus]
MRSPRPPLSHYFRITRPAEAMRGCVSLVRGRWLCRPMGCDFNWIPASFQHPQVKPVVLVLPGWSFFSSKAAHPLLSSRDHIPLSHLLLRSALLATLFSHPSLHVGPLICVPLQCGPVAVILIWSKGNNSGTLCIAVFLVRSQSQEHREKEKRTVSHQSFSTPSPSETAWLKCGAPGSNRLRGKRSVPSRELRPPVEAHQLQRALTTAGVTYQFRQRSAHFFSSQTDSLT